MVNGYCKGTCKYAATGEGPQQKHADSVPYPNFTNWQEVVQYCYRKQTQLPCVLLGFSLSKARDLFALIGIIGCDLSPPYIPLEHSPCIVTWSVSRHSL